MVTAGWCGAVVAGVEGKRRRPSKAYELRRLRICAEEAQGTVLDLGHAQFPNPYLDGARTTGLDISEPHRPSGYAADLVGSVAQLGDLTNGERYDTIVAGELIEHLERPYDFLRDVRPLLREGGRLVLSTPNPVGFPTLLFELARSRRWFYTQDHVYYFPPRWVERMLERTGYRVLRVRPVGLWLPIGYIPWCPAWCSYQLVYVAHAINAN